MQGRGRWIIALLGLAVIIRFTMAYTGADDGVTPAFGLFKTRKDREREAKAKEEAEAKPGLPPGIPYAPGATNGGAFTSPDDPEDPVLKRVEEAIRITKRRFLAAEPIGQSPQHTPWQIMHGILALRHDLELRTNRGMVNAIEWVSSDPVFRGEHWFEATRFGGRGHPFSVPYYFEGHVNQFLALMTMSNLPLDHRITVAGGKTVTMADMVRHAQMTVNANEEISWTLWFLTHYLEPDASWVNGQGRRWSMEELIRLQVEDELVGAPCGGTHGLFALSYARNSYLQKYGKLQGTWQLADEKIKRSMAMAKSMQNKDWSFSSHFFREPGWTQDPTDRLKTSGHMLEWLMMASPHHMLTEKWMRGAVANVATDLIRFSNQEVDPGALFHALHSIVLYRERMSPKTLHPIDAKPLPPQVVGNVPGSTKPLTEPPAEKPVKPVPIPEPPTVTPMPVKKPEDKPADPKPAGDKPDKGGDKPATPKVEPPKEMPKPSVAEALPPIPPLRSPELKGMATDKPKLPLPVDPPLSPSLAAETPVPAPLPAPAAVQPPTPTLKIALRSDDGDGKPSGAAADAPKATTVTQPTPIVLPPLPLDPIDQPAAGGK
jgi:hypothetical protein